jgi:hypothetical protein
MWPLPSPSWQPPPPPPPASAPGTKSYARTTSIRSKNRPPIGPVKNWNPPGFGGTLSAGAITVMVLAVTL